MGRYADAAPAHGLPDTSVFKLQYLPRLNSDRAVLWSILKKKSRATTWCPQICNPPKIRADMIAQRRPIFLPYASAPAVLPPQDGGLAWPGGGWAGRQRAVNGRQHQLRGARQCAYGSQHRRPLCATNIQMHACTNQACMTTRLSSWQTPPTLSYRPVLPPACRPHRRHPLSSLRLEGERWKAARRAQSPSRSVQYFSRVRDFCGGV